MKLFVLLSVLAAGQAIRVPVWPTNDHEKEEDTDKHLSSDLTNLETGQYPTTRYEQYSPEGVLLHHHHRKHKHHKHHNHHHRPKIFKKIYHKIKPKKKQPKEHEEEHKKNDDKHHEKKKHDDYHNKHYEYQPHNDDDDYNNHYQQINNNKPKYYIAINKPHNKIPHQPNYNPYINNPNNRYSNNSPRKTLIEYSTSKHKYPSFEDYKKHNHGFDNYNKKIRTRFENDYQENHNHNQNHHGYSSKPYSSYTDKYQPDYSEKQEIVAPKNTEEINKKHLLEKLAIDALPRYTIPKHNDARSRESLESSDEYEDKETIIKNIKSKYHPLPLLDPTINPVLFKDYRDRETHEDYIEKRPNLSSNEDIRSRLTEEQEDISSSEEHKLPKDIPTKPVYPGAGQWAKKGTKHSPYKKKYAKQTSEDASQHRPEGIEIFKENEGVFLKEQKKFEEMFSDFDREVEESRPKTTQNFVKKDVNIVKHSNSDEVHKDDNEKSVAQESQRNEEVNEDDESVEEFVPKRTYSQIRGHEVESHVPRDPLDPRLREVVIDKTAKTVYAEEGYEDSAYDHAGHEKNAENSEGDAEEEAEQSGKPSNKIVKKKKIKEDELDASKIVEKHLAESDFGEDEDDDSATAESKKEKKIKPFGMKLEIKDSPSGKVEVLSEIKKLHGSKNHHKFVTITPSIKNDTKSEDEGTKNIRKKRSAVDLPVIDSETEFLDDLKNPEKYQDDEEDLNEKYPYYNIPENNKEVNKASPLRYAENLKNVPVKVEGEMSFYDHADRKECAEVQSEVNPIPQHVKDKENSNGSTENEDGNDPSQREPPQPELPRLKGLGDKIDCFKEKYFGKNPLDSPFFSEEIIESPQPLFQDKRTRIAAQIQPKPTYKRIQRESGEEREDSIDEVTTTTTRKPKIRVNTSPKRKQRTWIRSKNTKNNNNESVSKEQLKAVNSEIKTTDAYENYAEDEPESKKKISQNNAQIQQTKDNSDENVEDEIKIEFERIRQKPQLKTIDYADEESQEEKSKENVQRNNKFVINVNHNDDIENIPEKQVSKEQLQEQEHESDNSEEVSDNAAREELNNEDYENKSIEKHSNKEKNIEEQKRDIVDNNNSVEYKKKLDEQEDVKSNEVNTHDSLKHTKIIVEDISEEIEDEIPKNQQYYSNRSQSDEEHDDGPKQYEPNTSYENEGKNKEQEEQPKKKFIIYTSNEDNREDYQNNDKSEEQGNSNSNEKIQQHNDSSEKEESKSNIHKNSEDAEILPPKVEDDVPKSIIDIINPPRIKKVNESLPKSIYDQIQLLEQPEKEHYIERIVLTTTEATIDEEMIEKINHRLGKMISSDFKSNSQVSDAIIGITDDFKSTEKSTDVLEEINKEDVDDTVTTAGIVDETGALPEAEALRMKRKRKKRPFTPYTYRRPQLQTHIFDISSYIPRTPVIYNPVINVPGSNGYLGQPTRVHQTIVSPPVTTTVSSRYKPLSEVHYKDEIKPNEQLNVFADIINNIKNNSMDQESEASDEVAYSEPISVKINTNTKTVKTRRNNKPNIGPNRVKTNIAHTFVPSNVLDHTNYYASSTTQRPVQYINIRGKIKRKHPSKTNEQLYQEFLATLNTNRNQHRQNNNQQLKNIFKKNKDETDQIYQNTRQNLLSKKRPLYVKDAPLNNEKISEEIEDDAEQDTGVVVPATNNNKVEVPFTPEDVQETPKEEIVYGLNPPNTNSYNTIYLTKKRLQELNPSMDNQQTVNLYPVEGMVPPNKDTPILYSDFQIVPINSNVLLKRNAHITNHRRSKRSPSKPSYSEIRRPSNKQNTREQEEEEVTTKEEEEEDDYVPHRPKNYHYDENKKEIVYDKKPAYEEEPEYIEIEVEEEEPIPKSIQAKKSKKTTTPAPPIIDFASVKKEEFNYLDFVKALKSSEGYMEIEDPKPTEKPEVTTTQQSVINGTTVHPQFLDFLAKFKANPNYKSIEDEKEDKGKNKKKSSTTPAPVEEETVEEEEEEVAPIQNSRGGYTPVVIDTSKYKSIQRSPSRNAEPEASSEQREETSESVNKSYLHGREENVDASKEEADEEALEEDRRRNEFLARQEQRRLQQENPDSSSDSNEEIVVPRRRKPVSQPVSNISSREENVVSSTEAHTQTPTTTTKIAVRRRRPTTTKPPVTEEVTTRKVMRGRKRPTTTTQKPEATIKSDSSTESDEVHPVRTHPPAKRVYPRRRRVQIKTTKNPEAEEEATPSPHVLTRRHQTKDLPFIQRIPTNHKERYTPIIIMEKFEPENTYKPPRIIPPQILVMAHEKAKIAAQSIESSASQDVEVFGNYDKSASHGGNYRRIGDRRRLKSLPSKQVERVEDNAKSDIENAKSDIEDAKDIERLTDVIPKPEAFYMDPMLPDNVNTLKEIQSNGEIVESVESSREREEIVDDDVKEISVDKGVSGVENLDVDEDGEVEEVKVVESKPKATSTMKKPRIIKDPSKRMYFYAPL